MRFTSIFASIALAASAFAAPQPIVSTVAGVAGISGAHDGIPAEATFNRPTWIDVDSEKGVIYVVDRMNGAIRRISSAGVTTLPLRVKYDWSDPTTYPLDFDGGFGGGIAVEPPSAGCGGMTYDKAIFVSSSAAHEIVFVADVSGTGYLATRDDARAFIGERGVAGANDGTQMTAHFRNPTGIALSWGYVGRMYQPDAVYIADTGNHTIRKLTFRVSFEACTQPYFVTTLAGRPGLAGHLDGSADRALFNSPRGLASAPDGSVYVADTGNHCIRRIAPDGNVSTVAGEPGVAGSNDGPAMSAHLNSPSGLAVSVAGELYIADTFNHTIRELTTDGRLVTIAGVAGVGGYADGPVSSALFNGPVGVRLDHDRLYVADTSNNVVRRIDFDPPKRQRGLRR